MARINVEQKALTDPRFAVLSRLAGMADSDHALGRMIRVWNECQERESFTLSDRLVSAIFGSDEAPNWLVLCELGSRNYPQGGKHVGEGLIRICGTAGRTDWLKRRRNDGRKGGVKGGRPKKPLGVIKNARQETPPAPAPAPALTQEPQKLPLPNPPQAAARAGWSALFPEFWNVYPRKIAKRDAEKAWAKLAPKSSDLIEPKALAIAYVLRDRKQRD